MVSAVVDQITPYTFCNDTGCNEHAIVDWSSDASTLSDTRSVGFSRPRQDLLVHRKLRSFQLDAMLDNLG